MKMMRMMKSKVTVKTGRKILILYAVLFFLASLMSGCLPASPNNVDRISRPTNKASPLEGTWKLEKCLNDEDDEKNTKITDDVRLGKRIAFSQDVMVFAENYFDNVRYKIKRVNANEYFLHKNQGIPQSMNLKSNEMLVITAYSNDKFLYEFIKDSEEMIVVNMDERYYSMGKISDVFTDSKKGVEVPIQADQAAVANIEDKPIQSGLLLGVRIPVQTEDDIGDYTYGTYWISSVDHIPRPVLYADDIYLPRMNGFWRLRVEKRLGTEGIEDFLHASMISKAGSASAVRAVENASERLETKLRKAVVYVGNDYVCVENTIYDKPIGIKETGFKKVLRTLPVDNLINIEGIKISDLVGGNGTIAMESAVAELLKESCYNGIKGIDEDTQEENFALFRKTGHWFFKGRLNLDTKEALPFVDFNLNLIPPVDMVAYDMLQVPWTEIKDKLPQAIDVYTSPEKDMAVILTRGEILIYAIENKMLSEQPLAKLPLVEGGSIIMAEWAIGEYVPSWERSFTKNNKTSMVDCILKVRSDGLP